MGPIPATSDLTRRFLPQLGLAACLVAASSFGTPAAFASNDATKSTTAAPAGHSYAASLEPGSTADFVVGATTVTCATSTARGVVPVAPNNHNAAGPVSAPFSPPTYSDKGGDCPTSVPLTSASFQSNADKGNWTIGMQHSAAGSTATLTVPAGGMVAKVSGLVSCTINVAPDGPYTITGKWIPGTATSAPKVDFSSGVEMPILVTGGFGCPTNFYTGTFKATYMVTNTTDPSKQITLTP